MPTGFHALAPAALAITLAAAPLTAQSALDRSPNLSGSWIGAPGVVHFNFLHRFSNSGAPLRKVTNYPTFLLAAGLPPHALAGVNYATNSEVAAGIPNEWEVFARIQPLMQETRFIDASLQAGYNLAAESVDGEISVARRFGRVRVIAAGRAFSRGFGIEEARIALAAGGTVRLTRWIALAGDAAKIVNPGDESSAEFITDDVAWSAGIQLALPYTPHSLSLQASNANTTTLEGASRAGASVRYGFEFTIPITLRRWFGSGPASESAIAPVDSGPVRKAFMRSLMYTPASVRIARGATVEWVNDDQVAHTVTADDGSWNSGIIQPGGTYRRVFNSAGRSAFHCTPHPFMKGVVVVE